MTNRLKLLQFTQDVHKDMGICPLQSNRKNQINWRLILMLISLVQMMVLSFAFLVFAAETLTDAITCFYAISTEASCVIYLLIKFNKMPKILNLIERFEGFIENSKSFSGIILNFLIFLLFCFFFLRIRMFRVISDVHRNE